MKKRKKPLVCDLCRRPISDTDQVAKVDIGTVPNAESGLKTFRRSRNFGEFHESCMRFALGDPTVLSDIAC